MSRVLGEAYMKAASPLNAINEFKECGIEPNIELNKQILQKILL